MLKIGADELHRLLPFPHLIESLRKGLTTSITVPARTHHNFGAAVDGSHSTLLLMPAWIEGTYLGVKIVTISPDNHKSDLPTIQGVFLLFDASTGVRLAEIDAPTLTNLRTAAVSALASSHLSREDSGSLLIVGTGSLAPYLVAAHSSTRSISKIYVWGRNGKKAKVLATEIEKSGQEVEVCQEIKEGLSKADIVSTATMSCKPLILGKYLRAGQHIDLVGAYRQDMREADNEAITRSEVFYDMEQGIMESGDLYQPISSGLIRTKDLKGGLVDLCSGTRVGRQSPKEITVFKSVGHASQDLIAAITAYDQKQPL